MPHQRTISDAPLALPRQRPPAGGALRVRVATPGSAPPTEAAPRPPEPDDLTVRLPVSLRRRLLGRPHPAAVLAVLLTVLGALSPAAAVSADPQSTGEWSPAFAWPILPIHASVLPDGRVLGFGGQSDGRQGGAFSYAVWDPAGGESAGAVTELPNTTGVDFFCSNQVLVPATGEVLIAGGDMTDMTGMDHFADGEGTPILGAESTNHANQTSNIFLPAGVGDHSHHSGEGDTVVPGPQLNVKRWYATTTVLTDGRILLQGGADRNLGTGVATPEVYDPATRTWSLLTGIADPDAYGTPEQRWWYPRAWAAPNGSVVTIAGSLITQIDTDGAGSLTRVATMPGTNIGATSTAVMYRPGLILQVGGGAFYNADDRPASAEASIIDLRSGTPIVRAAAPMPQARHWATATVLPTGDVLVTGGTPAPALWNPDTDTWHTLAAEDLPRLYHSVAALLPDGRVLSAAGGAPGPVLGLDAQVFAPPALFAEGAPAVRPGITSAPETVAAGESFAIGVDSRLPVAEVALVKTSAVTHGFNNDQRYVPLEFETTSDGVTARAPTNVHDLPPGWYQLWVVDSAGVPSVSAMVRVPVPG